jgi:hypothetical protein
MPPRVLDKKNCDAARGLRRGSDPYVLDPDDLSDHIDALYRAAWALCGSRHDAEDLVQETFANVLQRPRIIRGDNQIGYLLRALRNNPAATSRFRLPAATSVATSCSRALSAATPVTREIPRLRRGRRRPRRRSSCAAASASRRAPHFRSVRSERSSSTIPCSLSPLRPSALPSSARARALSNGLPAGSASGIAFLAISTAAAASPRASWTAAWPHRAAAVRCGRELARARCSAVAAAAATPSRSPSASCARMGPGTPRARTRSARRRTASRARLRGRS